MGPFSKEEKKLLREIVRQQVDACTDDISSETHVDRIIGMAEYCKNLKILLKKIK